MKKALIILLFIPSLVLSQELKDISKDTLEDLHWGYEYFMPTSSCGEVIDYNNFSVSFCEEYRLSEWSIYYRNIKYDDYYEAQHSRYGLRFKRDPMLNGRDVDGNQYKYNVWDKGHLVPAADMNFSYESLEETFFFVNCTPMHESFNRGGMYQLEKKIRDWTQEFGIVAIITGWVVEDNKDNYLWIGEPSIPVPNYYYKVFVDIKNYRSIAFLIPNKKITEELLEYVVSIDYLESITGLDFFYKLPDEIELMFEIDTGTKEINK